MNRHCGGGSRVRIGPGAGRAWCRKGYGAGSGRGKGAGDGRRPAGWPGRPVERVANLAQAGIP